MTPGADHQILVDHGKPLLFGRENQKGLRLNPKKLRLEVITLGEDGITEDDIAIHDETNLSLAELLAGMERPEFPVAFGVLYCNPYPSFESDVERLTDKASIDKGTEDLNALLRQGHTWTVEN